MQCLTSLWRLATQSWSTNRLKVSQNSRLTFSATQLLEKTNSINQCSNKKDAVSLVLSSCTKRQVTFTWQQRHTSGSSISWHRSSLKLRRSSRLFTTSTHLDFQTAVFKLTTTTLKSGSLTTLSTWISISARDHSQRRTLSRRSLTFTSSFANW